MTLTVKNISRGPQPLDGGRVLTRGQVADQVPDSPHTLALIEAGFLLDVTPLASDDLEDLTVAELRDLADERSIDVPASAKKADVIALLSNDDTPDPDVGSITDDKDEE